MDQNEIKKIVIVGGGTAGWMTAARLSRHFRKTRIQITLVESSDIGTVGVGEATIPTLRRFYADLDMTDSDVMRATSATCKLGIQFEGWHRPGSHFIHPFGGYGQRANDIDFHHYWMKLRERGDTHELAEYSLGVQLAQGQKFIEPSPRPPSELSVFDWALHFDAAKFAQLMRSYAGQHNVKRIDARITQVNLRQGDGFIESLTLDSGDSVDADLFIDCSGFRGLLIEDALKTGYEDWSEWLHCDSAVAVQSQLAGDPPPYTVSLAHTAGWQWRIPLQHRQGNGHVYCSRYISEDEAIATLKANIAGELLHEPRRFSFTAGRRKKAWNKNCIAVGLASGFLEPLESTSIALVETAIEKIRHAFQRPYYSTKEVEQFNSLTAQEYERVRDFIILHYKANQRVGEPFWDACRAMNIPLPLQKKMLAYQKSGELIRYPIEIFGPPSWLAIYSGFGLYPETYHPDVDRLDPDYLAESLQKMREAVRQAVASVPTHKDFIAAHCAVDSR